MQGMGIKLAFLPAGPDRAVAVRRDGGRSVVTHVLVRQVILRKRFDVESAVNRYVAQFPEILAREINGAAESSRVCNGTADEPSVLGLSIPRSGGT